MGYPLCPYQAAWNPGTPDGALGGGGIPGPTLGTQSTAAGAGSGVAARTGSGMPLRSRATIAAALQAALRGARLRLRGIDPELGDGLRDIGGTVLLAEGQRM